MSTWNPADAIYPEWATALRTRIVATKVDPELVRSWLAIDCGISRGTRLLEQLDCGQAVRLYNQITEWAARPLLYSPLAA